MISFVKVTTLTTTQCTNFGKKKQIWQIVMTAFNSQLNGILAYQFLLQQLILKAVDDIIK